MDIKQVFLGINLFYASILNLEQNKQDKKKKTVRGSQISKYITFIPYGNLIQGMILYLQYLSSMILWSKITDW